MAEFEKKSNEVEKCGIIDTDCESEADDDMDVDYKPSDI